MACTRMWGVHICMQECLHMKACLLAMQDAQELYRSALAKLQAVLAADSSNGYAVRAMGMALLDMAGLPDVDAAGLLQACACPSLHCVGHGLFCKVLHDMYVCADGGCSGALQCHAQGGNSCLIFSRQFKSRLPLLCTLGLLGRSELLAA